MHWREGSSPCLGLWERRKAVRFGDPGTCGWREVSQHKALYRRANKANEEQDWGVGPAGQPGPRHQKHFVLIGLLWPVTNQMRE